MKRMFIKKELVLKRMYSETTIPVGTPVDIEIVETPNKIIRIVYDLNNVIVKNYYGPDYQNDYYFTLRKETVEMLKEHLRIPTEMETNVYKYNL